MGFTFCMFLGYAYLGSAYLDMPIGPDIHNGRTVPVKVVFNKIVFVTASEADWYHRWEFGWYLGFGLAVLLAGSERSKRK